MELRIDLASLQCNAYATSISGWVMSGSGAGHLCVEDVIVEPAVLVDAAQGLGSHLDGELLPKNIRVE